MFTTGIMLIVSLLRKTTANCSQTYNDISATAAVFLSGPSLFMRCCYRE